MDRGQVAIKGELIGKAIAIVGGLREGLGPRERRRSGSQS